MGEFGIVEQMIGTLFEFITNPTVLGITGVLVGLIVLRELAMTGHLGWLLFGRSGVPLYKDTVPMRNLFIKDSVRKVK